MTTWYPRELRTWKGEKQTHHRSSHSSHAPTSGQGCRGTGIYFTMLSTQQGKGVTLPVSSTTPFRLCSETVQQLHSKCYSNLCSAAQADSQENNQADHLHDSLLSCRHVPTFRHLSTSFYLRRNSTCFHDAPE